MANPFASRGPANAIGAKSQRHKLLARLHIAAQQQGYDTDALHQLYNEHFGVVSSKLLTDAQLVRVVGILEGRATRLNSAEGRAGGAVAGQMSAPEPRKAGSAAWPMLNKITALLYALDKDWLYAQAILRRQTGNKTMIFEWANMAQIHAVVAALQHNANHQRGAK